jgi:hypothetical protein
MEWGGQRQGEVIAIEAWSGEEREQGEVIAIEEAIQTRAGR